LGTEGLVLSAQLVILISEALDLFRLLGTLLFLGLLEVLEMLLPPTTWASLVRVVRSSAGMHTELSLGQSIVLKTLVSRAPETLGSGRYSSTHLALALFLICGGIHGACGV
jgi:hypothetical protein